MHELIAFLVGRERWEAEGGRRGAQGMSEVWRVVCSNSNFRLYVPRVGQARRAEIEPEFCFVSLSSSSRLGFGIFQFRLEARASNSQQERPIFSVFVKSCIMPVQQSFDCWFSAVGRCVVKRLMIPNSPCPNLSQLKFTFSVKILKKSIKKCHNLKS